MDWKRMFRCLSLVVAGCSLLVMTGCGPDYPKCDTDDDCSSSKQGKKEGKLYCVNGLCQECREDPDCGDPSLECNAGVCEEIPGYCTSTDDCPGNQKCRENRCGPECMDDSECEAGEICDGGTCVEEPECSSDADCGPDQMCESGQCVDKPEQSCSLETVYFGYNSSSLSSSARSALQSNADCIKERGISVRIEGHADQRGTNEYNIALGERRARSARNYLRNLGVSSSNMSTVSYGEERPARQCAETGGSPSCYKANRRAEFTAQ